MSGCFKYVGLDEYVPLPLLEMDAIIYPLLPYRGGGKDSVTSADERSHPVQMQATLNDVLERRTEQRQHR